MRQSYRSSSRCILCGSLCLCGKRFPRNFHHRDTEGHRVSLRNKTSLLLSIFLLSHLVLAPVSNAQRQPSRNGAHSTTTREPFSAADRRVVERAIGATCAERVRDPSGSVPIDEMQARPSLAVSNPEAVTGLHRAERLLPSTRKLVVNEIGRAHV